MNNKLYFESENKVIKKPFIVKEGEAFLSLDSNWKCIYVNEWAEKQLDKKKDELLGLNFYSILPESSNVLKEKSINDIKVKQSSFSIEIFNVAQLKWILVSFIPHFNGIDIFLKDITSDKIKAVEKEKKEKRFSNAFESSPIALLIIDYTIDNIVDVNQSFLNLFEFSREEVIGKTFSSLNILQHKIEYENKSICDLLKSESIYKYDVIAETKSKNKLNIILSSETIKINGDKQLLLTFIDITEKIKFQNLISESEQWFRRIADNSPILIWGTDENMNCNYINQTWRDFTGVNNVDFNWQQIIHENDLKEFLKSFERSYKLKKSFKREFRLRNKDGVFKWMYEFAKPIILPDGCFKGFIGSCSDIDDKKNENINLEKIIEERTLELTQSLEKEKSLNDAKSRFVSLASHEFRTPLSSILSSIFLIEKYSNLIDEELLSSNQQLDINYKFQQQKHFDRIKKSINHLTTTLNDFLSIDQLEQGNFSVKTELFDLCQFSIDIVDELKPLLKKDQQIIFSFTGDKEINQDKRIIQNIFVNLLSNAIKYSSQQSFIYLTIQVDKKNTFVEVKDQGIGIPFHDQQNIFSKFFRADNVINIQGTGLGLNIVKRYTELINGDIVFQSFPQIGTSFIVSMPRNLIQ
jgi:PAS domain S-box-containing protein